MESNQKQPIDQPRISVIIPSFNQGKYIEETLISVIGQQYPNLEIIVIDGGSKDQTVDVIKKYEDKISYWHSQPDQGQADAINQGFKLSSGEILCWLNSDDMYLPSTLLDVGKRLATKIDENYLIYGGSILLNEKKEKTTSHVSNSEIFDKFTLTYRDFILQPSSFWTRKLWQNTGELNIDYNYALDWDWYIRATNFCEFEHISKVYSIYRIHEAHKTSSYNPKRKEEIIEIVNKYSSTYWADLYTEVDKNSEQIKSKLKWLYSRTDRIRRLIIYKKIFFYLLFPELKGKLDNTDHLRLNSILGNLEPKL